MVGTGHQYVDLAVCSLTVNHIFFEKNTCSFILFLSTAGSVGSFSTVLHTAFLHSTVDTGFVCKSVW